MIADVAVFVVSVTLGMVAGMQLHEAAHWIVLRLTGRSPTMHYPSLTDGRISARVTFGVSDNQIPADVRLAAIAPLLAALLIALPLLAVGFVVAQSGFGFAVGCLIWMGKLSPQDRRVARNRVNQA